MSALDICFSFEGIGLVKTCDACPEQYDAFNGRGEMVGYLRLRHGHFTVEVPGCGGERVMHCYPKGDGMFEPSEREDYLKGACRAIRRHLKGRRRP